jgi:hypothetical protein
MVFTELTSARLSSLGRMGQQLEVEFSAAVIGLAALDPVRAINAISDSVQ